MSGNGKQVQLPQNQSQRYTCIPTRPLTPQRADSFPVGGGGVAGGFVTSNAAGSHHTMRSLAQAPTPPQQDLKQSIYPQQSGVRGQQFPHAYRGGAPQGQPGVGVVHHQQRPGTHHRQQVPGPAPTPGQSTWAGQQVMYNMPVYVPTIPLHTTPYPPQQPTRPFYNPQTQHTMPMLQQQYYCPSPQQSYMYGSGGGPNRGGPSPAQMAPPQSMQQPQQGHQFVPTRYSSPMPLPSNTTEKKNRSHAIPIIDPKSGKEVVQDDNVNNSNESNERQLPQQDEISLAAVQEFSRSIINVAKKKDDDIVVKDNSENTIHVEEGNRDPVELNQNMFVDVPVEKSQLDYNEDKIKLTETPVVSAISNSPEIVPKQCHIVKPKPIETVCIENKKNQIGKVVNKLPNKPASITMSADNGCQDDGKDLGAQHILTSALQSSKLVDQDQVNKPDVTDDNTPLNNIETLPNKTIVDSSISCESENINDIQITCSNTNVPSDEVALTLVQSENDERQDIKVEQCIEITKVDLNADSVITNSDEVDQVNVCTKNQQVIVNNEIDTNFIEQIENMKISSAVDDAINVPLELDANLSTTDSENINTHIDDNIENNTNETTAIVEDSEELAKENNIDIDGVDANNIDMDNESENIDESNKADDKQKGPVLRYKYKDDQWSPLNTSGKKCYDPEFLMALKDDPNSKKKPDNLSQFDIFARPALSKIDLLPMFARSNATPNRKSQHGKPIKDTKGAPPSNQGGPPKPNIIHVNLSLRSDVKLNESENAWKPSRMRKDSVNEDDVQTQELCKAFTSTLNKLTPENFETLIAKVRKLNINTIDRLEKVIDLVFEKAIDEPNFSLTYALMCKELSGITLPTSERPDVSFRTLIIKRCQNEFEKIDDTVKKMQKEIDECTEPDKKKEMMLNLEEVESKIRRRSVGNVRFIGEIFKQNLIKPNIIIRCINHLLRKVEEDTLECLCKLLTTIGKDLEKKYSEDLQPYFNTMKSIVETKRKEISSRVRFMLQDVIDLRLNNWVPRQQANNPKTMDQIKLEMEMEQSKPSMFSNYSSPSNMSRKDDRPNNMNKRGGSKSTSDDVWSQAHSRNSRNNKTNIFTIDPGKLMITTTPVTQTSLQPSTPNVWSKGSKVSKPDSLQMSSQKNNRNSSTTSKKPTETSNSYLLLDNQYAESLSSNNMENSRKMSYKSKGASIERSTFKSNDSEERETNNTSSDSDEYIKDILAYAHSDTVYGMLGRINAVKNKIDISAFCKELILFGIAKEKEIMKVIGEVTAMLIDDDFISSENFLRILKEAVDSSSSAFAKEGSLICRKLGVFVWSHMKMHPLTLEQIHVSFSKAIELEYGFDLLTAIIVGRLKENPEDVKSLWQKSNLTLDDFMDEDRVCQFTEEFNLSWIYQKKVLTADEVSSQMLKQMYEGKSRDDVKEWIEKNVGNKTHEPWFIRALTEAIHTYGLCCQEAPKKLTVNTKRLEMFYPLLNAYISGQEKLELECLFGIQQLIHKHEHPQGITNQLFEYLWDSGDVVSLEGIISWENNDNPKELEGKGVMLKSLTSFLTSIKSEDQSSDEANSIVNDRDDY